MSTTYSTFHKQKKKLAEREEAALAAEARMEAANERLVKDRTVLNGAERRAGRFMVIFFAISHLSAMLLGVLVSYLIVKYG